VSKNKIVEPGKIYSCPLDTFFCERLSAKGTRPEFRIKKKCEELVTFTKSIILIDLKSIEIFNFKFAKNHIVLQQAMAFKW
jgi:hypothetical protein